MNSSKNENVVVFKDINFQKSVVKALNSTKLEQNERANKDNLYILEEDIKNIKTIEAREAEITSLEGIEKLIYLEEIFLEDNEIEDLSPISKLNNLREISFCRNKIVDISPIKELKNLNQISFDGNDIEDISPLKELSNLHTAIFRECSVKDLTPISELINLQEIWFDKNNLNDISAIEKLVNLSDVYLMGNKIEDLSPLKNLIHIENLYVNENNISSIEPLRNLKKLERLSIFDNKIEDISPIQNCKGLHFLLEYDNPIKNYQSLYKLKNVKIDKNEPWKENIKCIFKDIQSIDNDLQKVYYSTEDSVYFMKNDVITIACENKDTDSHGKEQDSHNEYYNYEYETNEYRIDKYDDEYEEHEEFYNEDFYDEHESDDEFIEIGQPLYIPIHLSDLKFIQAVIIDNGEDSRGTYIIIKKQTNQNIELGEGRIQISFSPIRCIEGVERIINQYSCMPDFNNDELLKINMEKDCVNIHIKIDNGQKLNNGQPINNCSILEFQFYYVSELHLSYWEQNSIIEKMEFTYDGSRIYVCIKSKDEVQCSFKCMKIKVN